jgi:hypothetical protein
MNILKLFTRQPQGSKYMPQVEIKPTSQKHEMLITLLSAYPDGVPTWQFNTPEIAIMNQWNVCRSLRLLKISIVLDSKRHVNKFGRKIYVSAYRIEPSSYQRAVEMEIKMRKEGNNE